MKENSLIGFLFSMIMIFCFYSCEDTQHGGQCQLTPDELSFLNFNKTSLEWDGIAIYYYDTIAFLYNNTDTMYPRILTTITGKSKLFDPSVHDIFGQTTCDFDKRTGIYGTTVNVYNEFIHSKARIDVIVSFRTLNTFHVDLSKSTDTAAVLGKTYNNVYKYEIPDSLKKELKSAFFAKKYGFIKIEAADGRKLERLDLSKDEIRTFLSD